MPRTTRDLDASVLEQLRRHGAREDKSGGQVASEQLAGALGKGSRAKPLPLDWPSKRMGKPQVDLEGKDALWA